MNYMRNKTEGRFKEPELEKIYQRALRKGIFDKLKEASKKYKSS